MNHPRMTNRKSSALLALGLILGLAACRMSTSHWEETTAELKIVYIKERDRMESNGVVQLLQAQLMTAGVPVTFEALSNPTFYQRVMAGDFQCALTLLPPDYIDPAGFLTDFYSGAAFRLSKYKSAEYDQSFLLGLRASVGEKRRDSLIGAHRLLMKDLPWVPLYSTSEQFLLLPGSEGFQSSAYQDYDYTRITMAHIRTASNVEPQAFDPALISDMASRQVAIQSYEGLVMMNDKLQVAPALAESWEFSAEMDRLTFNLRKDVKFQGGFGVLDAGDVKASFERMLLRNSPYAYIFDHVKGIQEFKAKRAPHVSGFVAENAAQFSIELSEPFPSMLNWLLAPGAFVLPAELPARYDFARGSVGTGPWVLTSWDGATATFAANSSYWRKESNGAALPRGKSLSIRVIKEAKAMLMAFEQAELDVFDVPPALYGEIFDQTGGLLPEYAKYKVKSIPLNDLMFLAFRMDVAPWGTDAALRQKASNSIDRDSIVRLLRRKVRAAHGVVPQLEGTVQ